MIELFECVPMMAKISKKQCAYNRKQMDDHGGERLADARCRKCAGLGVAVTIDPEEIIVMATMKNKACKLVGEGCTSLAWKAGYCWKHHPDHVANKKEACEVKQAIRDIHKKAPAIIADASDPKKVEAMAAAARVAAHVEAAAVVQVKEIVQASASVCEECGEWPCQCVSVQPVMVSGALEIANIDYIAFLRQLHDEHLEAVVSRLSQALTPYDRAKLYLSACDAITGLGR